MIPRHRLKLSAAVLLAAVFGAVGCVSSDDIEGLHRQMNDIEKEIQALERKSSSKEEVSRLNTNVSQQTEQLLKSNADTGVKLGELSTAIEQLQAKLEDTNRRLSQLSQQIAETQGDPLLAAYDTLFAATGYELWTSDGTTAGTVLVKDINPGLPSSLFFSPQLTVVGNAAGYGSPRDYCGHGIGRQFHAQVATGTWRLGIVSRIGIMRWEIPDSIGALTGGTRGLQEDRRWGHRRHDRHRRPRAVRGLTSRPAGGRGARAGAGEPLAAAIPAV